MSLGILLEFEAYLYASNFWRNVLKNPTLTLKKKIYYQKKKNDCVYPPPTQKFWLLSACNYNPIKGCTSGSVAPRTECLNPLPSKPLEGQLICITISALAARIQTKIYEKRLQTTPNIEI